MARREPSKQATLKEVLAEVSLVDVGKMLKGGLAAAGCLVVLFGVIAAIATASESTGYNLENLGIPTWLVWLLFAWMWVYSATSTTSWHEWNTGWYFPKLGWFGSLLLASYLLGLIYLAIAVTDLEMGFDRTVAAMLVWLVYPAPLWLFLAVIAAGHKKLMERRRAEDGLEVDEDRL